MARIKITPIMERMDSDIRRALKDAVDNVSPGNRIDEYELYREFLRAVDRKCNTWVRVPNQYVESE